MPEVGLGDTAPGKRLSLKTAIRIGRRGPSAAVRYVCAGRGTRLDRRRGDDRRVHRHSSANRVRARRRGSARCASCGKRVPARMTCTGARELSAPVRDSVRGHAPPFGALLWLRNAPAATPRRTQRQMWPFPAAVVARRRGRRGKLPARVRTVVARLPIFFRINSPLSPNL